MRICCTLFISSALILTSACTPSNSITKAQEAVKYVLKDPESAEWRNVRSLADVGLPYVCGEVNARNSMGGFTGFRHFRVDGGTVYLGNDEEQSLLIGTCCLLIKRRSIEGGAPFDPRTNYSDREINETCSAVPSMVGHS